MDSYTHAPVLPSAADATAYMELVLLSNEAVKLTKSSKFAEAEPILRDVLRRKPTAGFDEVSVALTKNELGSVLRQLGQYEEALQLLNEALEVRERYDEAVGITIALRDGNLTREEIAKVYEANGDCAKALETREKGKRICGSDACEALDYEKLHACTRCKSVFYCGKQCQGQDWRTRHRPLCQKAP
ncbi:hypothetical protein PHYBOEH_011429 [Phytophthora boehmeriae]|uniref:phytol kinase n=1 Tax=Phytophthora boehmeriae TaxID=109152 RepID=A0A8T1WXW1_9STRA|nr:hypothetical protein PHYBOEH_011429 [Phytophthora boehmeriae]